MDHEDLIARIAERLRRDHPDPAIRTELYNNGKLPEYVRTLINGEVEDDAAIARVIAAVQAADDGQPAHDE